jgi:hypothetical protein
MSKYFSWRYFVDDDVNRARPIHDGDVHAKFPEMLYHYIPESFASIWARTARRSSDYQIK